MQVNVTDVDDKIIKRARVNRLLADYVARREGEADSAAALSAVRKEASEAAAAFGAKMRAKLAKLEIPLADRREEDERQVCRVRVRARVRARARARARVRANPHPHPNHDPHPNPNNV